MKNTTIFLLTALLFAACERGEVETPQLKVSVASTEVKAGVPVDFFLSGQSDIIAFYSGESGNEYEHRTSDRIMKSNLFISYGTILSLGKNPSRVPFCYSADFDGTSYTQASIEAAAWTEITDLFTQPTEPKDGVTIPAGEVNMTNFFPDEETPIYLMFHYKAEAYTGNNPRAYWNIQNFRINGVTEIGTEVIYPFVNCGWQAVLNEESYAGQSTKPDINTTRILMRCDFNPAGDREHWIVGGPFYKQSDINMGPDRSAPIKANSDPMPTLYQHTFSVPGDYTVTFVGINASAYGRKENVRSIKLKVVEEDTGSIVPPSGGDWND